MDADIIPAAKRAKLAGKPVDKNSKFINVIEIDGKSCTHEVAWPPGNDGPLLPPQTREIPSARDYPFKIDPFQQISINVLEAGHSVLVAAHTSAGKTVVAEYAIAMALRDNQRVIYTSPLKALSNQKYNEFSQEFGDVGLLTGDVTINPTATCLVMTTEIFRSMLYRGSEIVREVQLIIYDEIHYLRDKERGVVWEESIVLAPEAARFVFLSATIPNAREFAEWIAKIHKSPCHVVYTEYRPTPLEHYMWPCGGERPFLVVDERGTFHENNFQKAASAVQDDIIGKPSQKKKTSDKDHQGKDAAKSDIYKLVTHLIQKDCDPLIVFNFSKLECERMCNQLVDLDLNEGHEKKMVDEIFDSAIDVLSEDDRRLPQVQLLLEKVRRGIAAHHSGLLPIVKEMIEIMFQEGLIKILFATETFSTGLNMPARTVVFTNLRKFDGGQFRWISGGEYIQMSGRAGRRGLDAKGIVVMMLDSRMEPATAKDMIKGAPDTLHSEFHLGYNMLLNVMRTEGAKPEELMRLSYRQFQTERALPILENKLLLLAQQKDAIVIDEEDKVTEYLALQQQRTRRQRDLSAIVSNYKHSLPFMQPGRLMRICIGDAREGIWVAVINFQQAGKRRKDGRSAEDNKDSYMVDVLANCAENADYGDLQRRAVPVKATVKGLPFVIPVSLSEIVGISTIRIFIPKDLRSSEQRAIGVKALSEVERRFPQGIPLLDPVQDMKITDARLEKLMKRIDNVDGILNTHPLRDSPSLAPRILQLEEKQAVMETIRVAKKDIKGAKSLILLEDLKARRKVLKRLGYIDSEDMVTRKGQVAAEISTGDELVLTELLFDGNFSDMRPEQLCAIGSCFIWGEKHPGTKVPEDMQSSLGVLRETARRVGKVAADCGIATDAQEYAESFRPDLMEVVLAWCRGAKFADISLRGKDEKKNTGTSFFEGSVVRAIRRLEELLRQVGAALTTVGDIDLAQDFEAACALLKRDIVFANSLFL